MLRITQPPASTPLLVIEGSLLGRYVDELRAACSDAARTGQPLTLDLDGLAYLDARAIALLEELAQGGARLVGGSAFVREVLRRIPAVSEGGLAGTDDALLAALRRDESAAQEELVRRFGPHLFAVARRFLSEASAVEALKEAFERAFVEARTLRPGAALEPWLHRRVVEAVLRRRKAPPAGSTPTGLLPCFHAHGVRTRDEADEFLALEGPGAHLESLQPEVQALVRACVDELPAPERTVLLLCDVEGFGLSEAARLLASDEAATRACLHRARQGLRALLGRALAGHRCAGAARHA
ncbi:MAG TPA: sigma factor-like helix-turn-helix DNA-binding protein [Planctomycetota bacterium]